MAALAVPLLLLGPGTAAAAAAVPGPGAQGAAAARPDFRMPFLCQTDWQLNTYAADHDPALDIVAKGNPGSAGRPVLASAAGTVTAAYRDAGAGNVVEIAHGGGWYTAYYHLMDAAGGFVEVGDTVDPSTQVGRIGATGANSGGWAHLHHEQRFAASGGPSDEDDRVPVVFDGVTYTGVGGQWPAVASDSCNGHWEDCPEGHVCFYSGPDGTGDVCGSDDDAPAADCGLRRSYFNNGHEEPGLDHVQVTYQDGTGQCLHVGWDEGRGNLPRDGREVASWYWRGEC